MGLLKLKVFNREKAEKDKEIILGNTKYYFNIISEDFDLNKYAKVVSLDTGDSLSFNIKNNHNLAESTIIITGIEPPLMLKLL